MAEQDFGVMAMEAAGDGGPEVSVVVPFYNPGIRLEMTMKSLVNDLDAINQEFEIIAVSDGSTDQSEQSIEGIDQRIRLVQLDRNFGKGEALRTGMSMSRGNYIGFIDADGDIPTSFMAEFIEVARQTEVEIIVGSKSHPDSRVVSSRLRRVSSLIWQSMTKVMFQLPLSDPQVGIKLFRRDVIDQSLPRTALQGFAFDIELLVVCHDIGFRHLVERPIEIRERLASTISAKSASRMARDLLVLFWRLRVARWLTGRGRLGA